MSQGGGGGRKDKKGRKLAPEIDSIAKTTATPCAHAITGDKFSIRKRMQMIPVKNRLNSSMHNSNRQLGTEDAHSHRPHLK